jgi:hypothetical protein
MVVRGGYGSGGRHSSILIPKGREALAGSIG